jgi:broad specificity phosphatase PhoE
LSRTSKRKQVVDMIYIIRHGQTDLNSKHVLQGQSDHPLNEVGERQAQEAALLIGNVSFAKVYSSPLTRALQTARIAAPGVPVVVDRRLIEMDYGPYEGMDLKNPSPEMAEFFSDFAHTPAPDGMEQLASVVERCGTFLEDVLEEARATDVLVSTHAIAMKGLLEYLNPQSKGGYWSKFIGNCAIYTAKVVEGGFALPVELR